MGAPDEHARLLPELAATDGFRLSLSLSSDEARFLAYWLLCAVPWPERALPLGFTTARALGRIFDGTCVQHRFLRKLAPAWLEWSERWVCLLAEAWRTAVDLQ